MAENYQNNHYNSLKYLSLAFLSGLGVKYVFDYFTKSKSKPKTDKHKILNEILEKINNIQNGNNINNNISNLDFDSKNVKNDNMLLRNNSFTYQEKKRKFSEESSGKIDLFKVCFTGGPCAGKTTAIATISEKLRELGYTVFTVPEAASLIFNSGGNIDISKYTDDAAISFQYHLLCLQIYLEDIMTDLAFTNSNKKKIILCDRGVMDGSAYMSEELWTQLCDEYAIDVQRLRDKRYDLIVHLVTAADGAGDNYNTLNNAARHESISFAKELDKKIQNAYMAHPNYFIVDNESQKSFRDKIDKSLGIVFKYIGLGCGYKFQNKFLIKDKNNEIINKLASDYNLNLMVFDVEDVVFFSNEDPDSITYYRKRERNGNYNFIKCHKSLDYEKGVEIKRAVIRREYNSMLFIDNANKYVLNRKRINFIWNKQNFIIDKIKIDGVNFLIMTEQSSEISIKVNYPEIIEKNIIRNVSNMKNYSTEYIARYGLKSFDDNDVKRLNEELSL